MLKDIIKFMFDNIGNLCSSTSIANTMTSNGRKISVPTVEKYLDALVEAFVLYKVPRYDIKGKNYLVTGSKYYLSDVGVSQIVTPIYEAATNNVVCIRCS